MVVTERGTFQYPHLSKPDEGEIKLANGRTVKANGKYHTAFILDELENTALINYAQKLLDAAVERAKKGGDKNPVTVWPFKECGELGKLQVKADSKYKPKAVDGGRVEFDPETKEIHHGSEGRMKVTIEDYVDRDGRVGVKLYLVSIQISKFANKPSSAASGFGVDRQAQPPAEPSEPQPVGVAYDFD